MSDINSLFCRCGCPLKEKLKIDHQKQIAAIGSWVKVAPVKPPNLTMRWKQFILFLAVGLLLSLCVACTQTVLESSRSPEPAEQSAGTPLDTATPKTDEPNTDPVAELPPETQQIVTSVSPEGLYNPPRGDVRLVVISDLNGVYGSTDYDPEVDKGMALIPFWAPDMVICSGDMVAGQDLTLTQDQIRAMWAAFDEHVAAPLRQAGLPYGFTIGNHDASSALGINDTPLFQQERDLASEYWNDAKHDPGLDFRDRFEFPFYYTFQYDDIFFLAWDGSSSHIPADKLAWVEETLASEEAQSARMRILLGHLPLYAVAVGRNEPGEVMENADQLRTMLEKYDVHTYISGHHHAYYPGHRGDLQLLHMGILGSGPRPLIDSNLPPWKAITVLDIDYDSPELTRYTTYDIQSLAEIEFEDLPRFLTGHNGIVLRRDVPYEALQPEEKALCEQRLGKALCEAS